VGDRDRRGLVGTVKRGGDKLRCDGPCKRTYPSGELRWRDAHYLLCRQCSLAYDRASSVHLPTRTDTPPSGRHVIIADAPASPRNYTARKWEFRGEDYAKYRGLK
jgi:hypothetical protein